MRVCVFFIFFILKLCLLRRAVPSYSVLYFCVVQAGKGAAWGGAGDGGIGGGVGLWEELQPGREAWLERGPSMGRGRLPAVMSDEGLATALLWRTETAELEKVCVGFLSFWILPF